MLAEVGGVDLTERRHSSGTMSSEVMASAGQASTHASQSMHSVRAPADGLDDVALRVVGLRAPDRPGIVVVPIGERTDLDVAAAGLLIALSPGRLLIGVDVERRVMLFHVMRRR